MMKIIPLAFLFFVYFNTKSQWTQTPGPCGGQITALVQSGSDIMVGTGGAGVFLSTNNGISWNGVASS